ncbi:MAG: DUF6805 domain-containing protein [Candidatus Zipacnadales bacterium]
MTGFWCCYGTGIESFSKLNDSIYFHGEDGLYVNLFISSTVNWRGKNVRVEQQTAFPEEQGTTLVIRADKPLKMKLHIRIPYWATQGVEVRVNGEVLKKEARPTAYLTLERTWKDGDKVEVRMPMSLHAAPLPDDPELVAVMYGPVVLAGINAPVDGFILGDPTKPEEWVHRAQNGPLTFVTNVQGEPIRLIPLYQVLDELYGVYWVVTPEGSERHKALLADQEARRSREARIVDRVKVGDATSEAEHNLQGERHGSGVFRDKHWRDAPSGWFSWDLQVLPDQPMTLMVQYWGSDVPPRTFDVLIDGKVIATQSLNCNSLNRFFEVEYAIPLTLTQGKTKVTVRFQAHEGNTAGGVFDCAILQPEK